MVKQKIGSTPQYQQPQNNFFTSSLPASNVTSQLFGNAANQNNEFNFQQTQQQVLNTSNDYHPNKSNSTSTSSLQNQSLNSSLSANQNNFLNSSNSNNQSFNNKPVTPVQNVLEQPEETKTNEEDSTQKQNDTDETPQARHDDNEEPVQELKNVRIYIMYYNVISQWFRP